MSSGLSGLDLTVVAVYAIGLFTPGICVVFLLGMFWKYATTMGALVSALGSIVFSVALKFGWPELPFMDRIGLFFLLCLGGMMLVSYHGGGRKPSPDAVDLDGIDFSTSGGYRLATLCCALILTGLYVTWW